MCTHILLKQIDMVIGILEKKKMHHWNPMFNLILKNYYDAKYLLKKGYMQHDRFKMQGCAEDFLDPHEVELKKEMLKAENLLLEQMHCK